MTKTCQFSRGEQSGVLQARVLGVHGGLAVVFSEQEPKPLIDALFDQNAY